jgi:putative cell wall-binding protein
MRVPVTYMKGADRYLTAIDVSKKTFTGGAPAVVLATGANFPDALCAAPLAGIINGPVLLVPKGGLTPSIEEEITRLSPRTVYICGSTTVVPTSVETRVKQLTGVTPQRLAGSDRYGTCLKIAQELRGMRMSVVEVFVTTGRNYPDALSAAPLANAAWLPIFLCDPVRGLSPAMLAELREWQTARTLLLGSEKVVPRSVEAVVPNPRRLGGSDRYETNIQVAAYTLDTYPDFSGYSIGLATGDNFPDALTAGPRAGFFHSLLILTHPKTTPSNTLELIDRIDAERGIQYVDAYGSVASVSDEVLQQVDTVIGD